MGLISEIIEENIIVPLKEVVTEVGEEIGRNLANFEKDLGIHDISLKEKAEEKKEPKDKQVSKSRKRTKTPKKTIQPEIQTVTKPRQIYECDICGREFDDIEDAKEHEKADNCYEEEEDYDEYSEEENQEERDYW